MTLRTLFLAGVMALAPLAASPSGASADPRPPHTPKLTIDEARRIALAKVAGTVIEEDLERERGVWVYEFDIRSDAGGRRIVTEISIDADTGAVVEIDHDDDDDDDDYDD